MIRFGILLVASLSFLGGCQLDDPLAPEVPTQGGGLLSVSNINSTSSPFRASSFLQVLVREESGVGAIVTNYKVRYSYNGTTYLSGYSRITNPTTISLNNSNGYSSGYEVFIVGSQPVVDGKGSNDRVHVEVTLQGTDSLGRNVEVSFTTTWSI